MADCLRRLGPDGEVTPHDPRDVALLDYIEGQGQVLAFYLDSLRRKGWENVTCVLPHDGINENNITGKKYVDHLREAGFQCDQPIPNQGRGAAALRIET